VSEKRPGAGDNAQDTGRGRMVLILGGARSGKSTFAEQLATNSQRSVAFIATAAGSDDEMRERIARHRAARPAGWQTLEETLDLAGAIRRASQQADVLLLDCLTLWLSNILLQEMAAHDEGEAEMASRPESLLVSERAMKDLNDCLDEIQLLGAEKTVIMVSNEVGLGIVPSYALGRLYRDMLGYVNQRVAQVADCVYLMVAGIAVDIKRLQEDARL
jgi:adenosylcobinamide kinase / adenosylcobinamide-phosphate guanylyltransferase